MSANDEPAFLYIGNADIPAKYNFPLDQPVAFMLAKSPNLIFEALNGQSGGRDMGVVRAVVQRLQRRPEDEDDHFSLLHWVDAVFFETVQGFMNDEAESDERPPSPTEDDEPTPEPEASPEPEDYFETQKGKYFNNLADKYTCCQYLLTEGQAEEIRRSANHLALLPLKQRPGEWTDDHCRRFLKHFRDRRSAARTALKAAHTVEAKFEALDQVFLETLQVLHVEAAPLDSDDEESDEKEYSPPAQDDTEDESTPSPPSKGKGKAKAAPKAATKGVTVAVVIPRTKRARPSSSDSSDDESDAAPKPKKTRKYEPRANKISTGNNSTAVQRWINGICIPCSKKNTKCIFRYAKSGARKHCCEECLRRKIKCTKEPLGTDDEEHLPSDQDTDLPDSDEPVQGIAQRSGTQGRIEELEYLVADLQGAIAVQNCLKPPPLDRETSIQNLFTW
ncbi:hypothetical protein BDZ89DRAFT_1053358 [Hymenopellis radicata]|nr:hypothetical protein BDZ89DRAFT_1053358 [Hymenopellis radicata]